MSNSHSPARSMAWKERSFLIPLLVGLLGTVFIVLISMLLIQQRSAFDMAGQFIGVVMGFACLAGLAIGCIMFAPERDLGTDEFLATLPVSGNSIASSKILEGLKFFFLIWIGLALIAAALFLFANGKLSVRSDAGVDAWEATSILAILTAMAIPIECLLWSMIASSRISKPIFAVVIAGILSLLGVLVVTFWIDIAGIHVPDRNMGSYLVVGHALLVTALAAYLWLTSGYWLRFPHAPLFPGLSGGLIQRKGDAAMTTPHTSTQTTNWSLAETNPSAPLRSLFWQMSRTHWLPVLACGLIAVVGVAVSMAWSIEHSGFGIRELQDVLTSIRATNLAIAIICGFVIGLSVFGSDQGKDHYRFFQQRADYPKHVWLARHAVILVVALMLLICFCLTGLLASASSKVAMLGQSINTGYGPLDRSVAPITLVGPLFVFFAVAGIAQLISIFFRSGIAMILIGICICGCLSVWFCYLEWLDEPLFYFGWPMVLVSYLASWFYCSYWIREQRWWTGITVSMLSLLICFSATLYFLQRHRLNEIQPVESLQVIRAIFENQDQEFARDPAKYQAAMAIQATRKQIKPVEDLAPELMEKYPDLSGLDPYSFSGGGWPDELLAAFCKGNEQPIERCIAALEDPNSRYFPNPASAQAWKNDVRELSELVAAKFEYHRQQGETEAALRLALTRFRMLNLSLETLGEDSLWMTSLIQWSEMDGQNYESLKGGLDQFDQALKTFLNRKSEKMSEAHYRKILDTTRSYWMSAKDSLLVGYIPAWEIERTMRAAENSFTTIDSKGWQLLCSRAQIMHGRIRHLGSPMRSGVRAYRDHTTPIIDIWSQQFPGSQWPRFITAIRYCRLRLALAAYAADHGQLPESLAELEGKYLDIVPVASDGRDFAYSKTGADLPIVFWPAYMDRRFDRGYVTGQELNRVTEFVPANRPYLLPFSGLVFEKRQFIALSKEQTEVLNVQTGDVSLTPTQAGDRKVGYWISTGPYTIRHFSELGLGQFLLPTQMNDEQENR